MIVPHIIRDYLLEKFRDNSRLSSNDVELVVPSIFFSSDYNRHMSINLESGLWQCFKSGKKGNFVQLYAHLEGVSYNKAESELLFKELLSESKPKPVVIQPLTYPKENLDLVPITLGSIDSTDPRVLRAWRFIYERKLFDLEKEDSVYYISTSKDSRYKDRVIIPFEEDGNLFYFQARSLGDSRPKYLNPSEGWPKGSHVLLPFNEDEEFLFVCEGPLDAEALKICNVNATCTIGSSVSEQQIDLLLDYNGKIVIAYDNDKAGRAGTERFDKLRRIKRMTDLYICHPPEEVKDWNDALIKGIDLQQFVIDNTEKYDYDYLVDHLLTTL